MNNNNIYIHYGSSTFDNDKWEPIENENWIKPHGGLWASKIDSTFGWKDWCERNNFELDQLKCNFTFKLKDDAKILTIDSINVLERLHKLQYTVTTLIRDVYFLNFERLLEDGYDAIDFQLSKDHNLYWAMYGWDCDSILILNKDIINYR